MRITDIKVFPVREEKLKAFISIVLDECFMVNDIKVIKGKEGFFISMPSRRKRNGKFKDVAHPLNNETRQSMEKEILAAYEEALAGASKERAEVKVRPAGGAEAEKAGPEPEQVEPGARGAKADELLAAESDPVSRPEPDRREVQVRPGSAEIVGGAVAERANDSADESEGTDRSLEEVTERHLRDSFWGT